MHMESFFFFFYDKEQSVLTERDPSSQPIDP